MTFTVQRFAHGFKGHCGLTIPAELAVSGIPIQAAARLVRRLGDYSQAGSRRSLAMSSKEWRFNIPRLWSIFMVRLWFAEP